MLIFSLCGLCEAQRFMRQGFSNQEDFGSEMKVENNENTDMTREMFLMQDLNWNLPKLRDLSGIKDAALRAHVHKYLSADTELKLTKKRGKLGLRAIGKTSDGKKLRAFWRQATPKRLKTSDFLTASYDDAVRSRLCTVEFEIQLPPLKKSKKVLPSVVYQVAVEPGSMNAKAMVPRGAGKVTVLPEGRGTNQEVCEVGDCNVGVVRMKSGIVDPTWAKGRAGIFRKGRKSGLV